MRILEYTGLDPSRLRAKYKKLCDAIERDDFRQAEVRKLTGTGKRALYRAKLDDTNRVLFTLLRHDAGCHVLMLEIIENHAYEKSRFLRGAPIDEAGIPLVDVAAEQEQAEAVRYLHPERRAVHLLDKVISFDDAQQAVFARPAPLVVVGSAGSGKTALTLEKLKGEEGEVLYVTRSSYLAQNARSLYFDDGFDPGRQEASFLSYGEFIESLHVPPGREVQWRDFSHWFARQRQAFRDLDSHQAFEEIQGVLAAGAHGPLDRATYLALGVRESLFVDLRDRLYDLFERYRDWLEEAGLYDASLIAHRWQQHAAPRYDFIVVDEVQDLTNSQLALILATLKKPGQFLLCGDSNQIVHPNFFSWSKIRNLFWHDAALAEQQQVHVLRANFRNSKEATRIANTLLKIRQRRFGSVDRESNFLVDPVGGDTGSVTLLADRDAVKKDLDQRTRRSTGFAVLVMHDEDKEEAQRHFSTPLVFSVREAKGLEYDSIVLYRFVSGNRTEFAGIAQGVEASDLVVDEIEFRRARDKSDKSLEINKFYVNALYVALTRAVRHLFLIESDLEHPLLQLLGAKEGKDAVPVEVKASSLDDWQKEARKLELQGKQEQADAIRNRILRQTPVPWPVFDEIRLRETLAKVFREKAPGNKSKQQLLEYAACHDEPTMAKWLAADARFGNEDDFARLRDTLGRKHYAAYGSARFKDILQICDRHGVDHRTPMNQTPLMAAAVAGNVGLVDALLERGADSDLTDHLGRNALHWSLLEAFANPGYAHGPFVMLYERLAPSVIDFKSNDRLVRIDRHQSEYLLVQTLWALFKSRFTTPRGQGGFDSAAILDAWQHLPARVLRSDRNRRQYLSALLSRNEVNRDYTWNRRLFQRMRQGWYQFNPLLSIRRGSGEDMQWVSVLDALNLRLVAQGADLYNVHHIDELFAAAGQAPSEQPTGGESERREMADMRERAAIWRQENEERRRYREQQRREKDLRAAKKAAEPSAGTVAEADRSMSREPVVDPPPAAPLPWGTPAARRAEIERIRREIAQRHAEEAARAGDEPEPQGP